MHAIALAKTLIWKGGPGASFWPLPSPSYQRSEQRERVCPTQDQVPGWRPCSSNGLPWSSLLLLVCGQRVEEQEVRVWRASLCRHAGNDRPHLGSGCRLLRTALLHPPSECRPVLCTALLCEVVPQVLAWALPAATWGSV